MKSARRHIKARPEVVDGHRFDSQAELRRYRELLLLQRAGEIRELQVHPTLPLVIKGRRIGRRDVLTLDFRYERWTDGHWWEEVWEDVKGVDTRESRLRREVAEAIHGITITVVDAGGRR